VTSPAAALTEPTAQQIIPETFDKILSFPDYFSVGHWILVGCEQLFGVNPAEWIAKEITGDWEAVAKAGSALKNLGTFNEAFAGAVDTNSDAMFKGWTGNAASAASGYFDKLPEALRAQISALNDVGHQFEQAAYGVWGVAKTLVSLMELLLDLLIAWAIEAAATAAASWTVIGGIIGGSAMVLTAMKAIKVWGEICKAHGLAWTICTGVTGIIAGYLSNLHGMKDHPLPAGAYDHAGA
jgi:hypothetical protein